MSEAARDVRFGVVGFGLFGRHHAAAIAAARGATLAAIAAPSAQSQAAAGQAHPDADVVGDYRELVSRDDIDVIDIVAPNHLHHEIGTAALKAGRHVFIEKPMALRAAHCDELVDLARSNGRLLAVNHELRLSALFGRVRQLIDEGVIGRPQYALVELSRFPYRQGSQGWRYDAGRVGNWILEEPIHFFDLARWYLSPCGDPSSVYARGNARDPRRADLHDNFTAVVNWSGGEYAVVSQTLAAFEHHVTVKTAGEEGTIWAHWSAPDARSDTPTFGLRYGLGDDIHEVKLPAMTGELVELAQHVDAVVRCVREDGRPPCTGEDGWWSTVLCLAAVESVQRAEVVTIDDVRAGT